MVARWIDGEASKLPDRHGSMEEIQTYLERGNVYRVRELIEAHPDAATPYQRDWLEQQLKKNEGGSK